MPPHVWPHLLVVLLLPGVALKSHWHYLVCPDYAAVLCLAHGGLIFIKSWMGNTFLMWVVRKHSKKYTLHVLWFDCNFAPA